MNSNGQPLIASDEITDYFSYLKSIDWTEPWLIGLIVAHVLLTLTSFLTRNHTNLQIMLFLTLLSLTYFSEYLNEVAARNWQSFSRQQYFDSNGLFISTVFCIPMLLNCMILIGNWLYAAAQMMVTVKTAQLKLQARKQQEALAKPKEE